jgi:hypothetical protein
MFKKLKLVGVCIWLLLTGQSCIEEADIKLRSEKPKLVVDGLVTNENRSYSVKLSYTGVYTNSNFIPNNLVVNGARVTIKDSRGNSYNLLQDLQELGTYRTADNAFVGQLGNSYSLHITLPSGEKYSCSPETLQSVSEIDKLNYEYKQSTKIGEPDQYRVSVSTKDPATPNNYYRWRAYGYSRWQSTGALCSAFGPSICYEYCWVPTVYPQIVLASDANFNGKNITNIPVYNSPIRSVGNHFIEVTQYSLSKNAYTFWQLYEEQRKRVGSIFDPQPAPIEGNVVNENDPNDIALGYFGASAVSIKKLIIPFDETKQKTNTQLVAKGDCRLAFLFASLSRPSGFDQ